MLQIEWKTFLTEQLTLHSLILDFVYAHRAGWNGQIGSVWLSWKIFVYAVLFWAKKGSEITLWEGKRKNEKIENLFFYQNKAYPSLGFNIFICQYVGLKVIDNAHSIFLPESILLPKNEKRKASIALLHLLCIELVQALTPFLCTFHIADRGN